MPILVRPAAAADIDEAFLWYERQQAGLGEEFLTAVQAALKNVVAHRSCEIITSKPVLHSVSY